MSIFGDKYHSLTYIENMLILIGKKVGVTKEEMLKALDEARK